MDDSTTKKTEEKKTTVEDMYNEVDSRIQKFTMEFMNFLPKSDAVAVNIQLIADRLLTVKESAKLLINNFVIAADTSLAEDKENKDD